MQDQQSESHSTAHYDELTARMNARNVLFVQDELVETLTDTVIPDPEQLTAAARATLSFIGITMIIMSVVGIFANPIGGIFMAAVFSLLWCYMVSAAKEIRASEDGAGNMYRNQRVGRSERARALAEEQKQAVEAIVEAEVRTPQNLLQNLDDPAYVRTLKEALHRDENGWTMSD